MTKLMLQLALAVAAALPAHARDQEFPGGAVDYTVHSTNGGRGARSRALAITVRNGNGAYFLHKKELEAAGYDLSRQALFLGKSWKPAKTFPYGAPQTALELAALVKTLAKAGKPTADVESAKQIAENRKETARLRALVLARRAAEGLKPQPDPEVLKKIDEAAWQASEFERWTGFAVEELAKPGNGRFWKAHTKLHMAEFYRDGARYRLRD